MEEDSLMSGLESHLVFTPNYRMCLTSWHEWASALGGNEQHLLRVSTWPNKGPILEYQVI